MVSISLEQVGLQFLIRGNYRITLKELLVGRMRGKKLCPSRVQALRDIDLHVSEGERLGILGHNGAGKTTMLRLMAGIYPPTTGRLQVEGRISSLFEITNGFELEASGWENICYRGYLQGETPWSIRAKMQAIAEFSELGDFLDMPARCYSSGMLVRLAFAIATTVEPEILLVDETLSVGDMAFQQKARQRMKDMMAKARLMVVVSHDLEALKEMCSRGIWLDHGQIRQAGPMKDIVAAYKDQAALPKAAAA